MNTTEIIENSSGNVFADLECEDAAEMSLKAGLAVQIVRAIRARPDATASRRISRLEAARFIQHRARSFERNFGRAIVERA